ncbi:MAG: SUMF1/EgtB/PvdO family nonheme iron enzyme [Candidatus Sumerlaeota bacterium]|nr:SUMF1/EgtB/PvdO family nonheme iron enzyme [Candidatus Sumerlaeota bacterium]
MICPDLPSASRLFLRITILACGLILSGPDAAAQAQTSASDAAASKVVSLRAAIADLQATFGARYPHAQEYINQLEALESAFKAGDALAADKFEQLRQKALLENPLLSFGRLLTVKRAVKPGPKKRPFPENSRNYGHALGMPSNHECNSSLPRDGYDNEIAILSPILPEGQLRTLYRPDGGGYVGEVDLHADASRLLFTQSDSVSWKVWEIRSDGSGLRQVSQMPDDVDCFDACYLPNGKIICGSTASFQAVPCWHGQKFVSNLYLMNADGTGARQLCFDQDHDFHPSVLPNGQVLYHRWDYTGISHIYLRQLMVMNPDGSGQRAIYGSNSWYPNALYFPRAVGGESSRIVCILSGYHGVHRMGQLVSLDTARGWQEAEGITQRISGRGDPIVPIVRDSLVDQDWPKFLHPYPLSDKYFLVSARLNDNANWGIYLTDVFDNLTLIREEPGCALLEPVPLAPSAAPPVIPDRVDLSRQDGAVYLHDVYAGPGLKGVPRGTVKSLRVIAYHFGYRSMAGPDKIGYGGPWEVVRILGLTPLESDGSAHFRVPANTPIAVQPLDAEGKAVQLMRSWFTAMPGETVSCVGCHERPADVPSTQLALAARHEPRDLTPWRGPARGFDFERETQPVLDRYCVSCHDGTRAGRPDLRSAKIVKDYRGRRVSQMEIDRMPPQMRKDTQGFIKYTPAYDALISYIRRVGIEDDVSLLLPGEYHADTSPLVQMLRKGHHGVELDAEAWDRIVTWIDLNGPCHGTWGAVYPIPDGAAERRLALRKQCGGPAEDPEAIPEIKAPAADPVKLKPLPEIKAPAAAPIKPKPLPKAGYANADGWPFFGAEAHRAQLQMDEREKSIALGGGVMMKLVHIPAGKFVMGDLSMEPDERPLARVTIGKSFWMGVCEVTNEQFRCFDPSHDCRYYVKRHAHPDDQGLPLNGPQQPAVRVSWEQAMAFCHWLSEREGLQVTLPTEAQWEWACRAGSPNPLRDCPIITVASLPLPC